MSRMTASSSALYLSTAGSSQIHVPRETFEDRIRQWRHWLLGTDHEGKKLCMGRSLVDWLLLMGAYTALLVLLLMTFIVMMALFYWIVDWNYPTVQGPAAILQTPGIGFRPQPNIHNTIIRYVKGDITTYHHYVDQIEAYLKYYENQNQQGENYIDCNEIRERRTEDLNKVCRFDLMELGQDCVKQQNFGFDNGQPCVLIKLNKTETDKENHGDITIWPHKGFHFKYFPFRNQQGYRSPLVFVRFENPLPGVLLMITCKAWARNIVQDSNEMVGMVHFELMVD
ncbi:hypothetical protein ACOMHN_004361 [Nucella lapillus]